MIRKTPLWTIRRKGITVTATEYEGGGRLEPYPLPRNTWLRAIKLVKKFGADQALQLIDERARSAFRRNDDKTAILWRNLIIAIHAMQEDELLPGERTQ